MSFRPAARQFFERRGAPTPPLPYDAEVEYLESTGTQWIELDYFVGNMLEIFGKVRVVGDTSEQDIVGNQDDTTGRFALGWTGGNSTGKRRMFAYSRDRTSNDGNAWLDFPLNGNLTWEFSCLYNTSDNYKILTDGTKTNIVRRCKNISNMNQKVRLLSGTGGASNSFRFTGRTFFLHLKKDGVSWYNLIPVRKEGVGYMYDRVSGQLLGNGGTGDFVIGPDK